MTQRYIGIGDNDWGIVVCYNISYEDLKEVGHLLSELGARRIDIDRALNVIMTMNSGFSYSDEKSRMSLVCIGPASSDEQLFDSVLHELKHVVEHISKYYGVPSSSEPAAYLQGEVGRQMYRYARDLVCPTCGRAV